MRGHATGSGGQDNRRRGVRRTVTVLAGIALLIYAGFVARGVLG